MTVSVSVFLDAFIRFIHLVNTDEILVPWRHFAQKGWAALSLPESSPHSFPQDGPDFTAIVPRNPIWTRHMTRDIRNHYHYRATAAFGTFISALAFWPHSTKSSPWGLYCNVSVTGFWAFFNASAACECVALRSERPLTSSSTSPWTRRLGYSSIKPASYCAHLSDVSTQIGHTAR